MKNYMLILVAALALYSNVAAQDNSGSKGASREAIIDPTVFAPKEELYPRLWNSTTKRLDDNVRLRLQQVAEDFIRGFEHPLEIKDIVLTGSLANYNWNQYSDVDLHVVLDLSVFPDGYRDAFAGYFNAKRLVWNTSHSVKIVGHDIEVYIQDVREAHYSTGVYSVLNDKWIVQPSFTKQDIQYDDVIGKTKEFIEQINDLSDLVSQKDYQKAQADIDAFIKNIKKYRQAGLQRQGEYSTENLVYKMLRNGGHLERLSSLKNQAYDSEMSIE